ncbi:MAG: acyltransferase, partial [Bryobacterales bacterium]|nr:acyltransferase [Bryobacterales bacterium]
ALDHRSHLLLVLGTFVHREPVHELHFAAAFLVGVSFFLYRNSLLRWLTGGKVTACALVAATAMYRNSHLAEAALVTFGAACLFWLALKAPLGPLQRINNRWDISYGVYLYGWPVANLFRWHDPGISPWSLAILTLPVAAFLGVLSWWGIERRAIQLGRGLGN